MKKIIKVLLKSLAIFVTLIIALLIIVPLFFKDKIKEKIVQEANKNIEAVFSFEDFSLSLFRSFPDMNFRLENVSVVGIDQFDGDTLAGFRSFEFVFDLGSVLGKEGYKVKSIILDRPVASAIVLKDGTANWDIVSLEAQEGEPETVPEKVDDSDKKEKELKIALEKIEVKRGELTYLDNSTGIKAGMGSLDLKLSGNFSEKISDILVDVVVKRVSLFMEGEKYLDNITISGNFNVLADMENSIYTLKENLITVNDLKLGFDGKIEMNDPDINIMMVLETGKSEFKSLLSLIPAFYMAEYSDLNAEGSVTLRAVIDGNYSSVNGSLPGINLNIDVADGSFGYGNDPKMLTGLNMGMEAQTKGDNITAKVEFNTDYIDLGGIMSLMPSDTIEEAVDTADLDLQVVRIPENVDFKLNASIGKFMFDPIDANNLTSRINISKGRLTVDNTSLETLGGKISMSALYISSGVLNPVVEASVSADGIGIKESYETFNTVRKLAPIADGMDGSASVLFEFSSILQQNMMPDLNSINGKGRMESSEIELVNSSLFGKFSSLMNLDDKFTNTFEDIVVEFRIENGRVYFKPFDTKLGNIDLKIGGDHGLDQTINYLIASSIPSSDLPGSLKTLATGLAAQAAMFGIDYTPPEKYNVNIAVGGTVKDPTFKPSLGDPGKSIGQTAKESVKKIVNEKVEEVKETVNDEISRQADRIIEEAEQLATKVKSEAASAATLVRQEADRNAQKLIDEASSKGILAKAAASKAAELLKKEAESKAVKIEQEAAVKADKILEDARLRVEKLKQQ